MSEQNRQYDKTEGELSGSNNASPTSPLPLKMAEDDQGKDTNGPKPTISPPSPVRNWWSIHMEKIKHVGLHEWLMLAATLVMAVSTVAYTHYSAKQWDTMNNTLLEIKKQTPKLIESTEAAKRASETAALTMRLDERAWIVVEYAPIAMDVGSRVAVPLIFKNAGKTEARNLTGVISVSVTPANATPDFTYVRGYYSWNTGYLAQNTKAPTTWNALDRGTRQDFLLTDSANSALRSGKEVMTIHGRIDYDDIFRIHHWIKFCDQGGAPENGMQLRGNKACSDYNRTDDNR